MTTTTTDAPALERLSSGIPGLDTVLGGGFFRSGVYILHGLPGSGKTIFANQLCFAHVAAGGTAVYVTLLAESHSRMLQHIRALRFFDETAIPERLTYLSAFHQLETGGLKGLVELLRREMRARSASVLVLDGLVAAAEVAQSDSELKRFVHELQTSAVFHGCTAFLLTSGSPHRVQAEHTMKRAPRKGKACGARFCNRCATAAAARNPPRRRGSHRSGPRNCSHVERCDRRGLLPLAGKRGVGGGPAGP